MPHQAVHWSFCSGLLLPAGLAHSLTHNHPTQGTSSQLELLRPWPPTGLAHIIPEEGEERV